MESKDKPAVRNASCSSCGAQVPIYSRASLQAVCPFCNSTLVRTDLQWDTIGKMAALADDLSPFSVGMKGKYKNTAFQIIGRIQQQYDEGIWNEWLLQLSNRQFSWLGEGSGLFYLTVPSTSKEPLPEFKNLRLGQQVVLDGKSYSVSNIEKSRCIATEGEIPFAASPGQQANLVDLVGENETFASLDYSDDTPTLYVGRTLDINELQCETANKILKKQATQALRCAGCGGAVTQRNPASLLIACASCGMANNVSAAGKLVTAFGQSVAKMQLAIPLGCSGILNNHKYEVIGFMRRSGGGDRWDEYLLYNPSQGIRWLVCASGHWSLLKACAAPGYVSGSVFYKGRTYKHFSTYSSTVDVVLGEFYWQVKKGEKAECADFISPPNIISSERSSKEITWTEGVYISAEEIATAFNVEKVRQKGDGINQPSPPIVEYISAYIATVFLALLIATLVHINQVQVITIGQLNLTNNSNSAELVSEPFTLRAAHSLFQVQTNTSVQNEWVDFEYRLTNQQTGESRLLNREVAYYSGYDSDGSWSEGSNSDEASLANVPAGTYVLEVSAETDQALRPAVNAKITVSHGKGSSKNIWLILILLGIGPLLAGINKYYFEKRRWDASDHPWE